MHVRALMPAHLGTATGDLESAGCRQSIPVFRYTARPIWAVSSAVEHRLHTARVAGSNPAPPTRSGTRRSRPQAGFCRLGPRTSAMDMRRPCPDPALPQCPLLEVAGGAGTAAVTRNHAGTRVLPRDPAECRRIAIAVGMLGAAARDLLRSGEPEYSGTGSRATRAWTTSVDRSDGRAPEPDRTADLRASGPRGDRASARTGTRTARLTPTDLPAADQSTPAYSSIASLRI